MSSNELTYKSIILITLAGVILASLAFSTVAQAGPSTHLQAITIKSVVAGGWDAETSRCAYRAEEAIWEDAFEAWDPMPHTRIIVRERGPGFVFVASALGTLTLSGSLYENSVIDVSWPAGYVPCPSSTHHSWDMHNATLTIYHIGVAWSDILAAREGFDGYSG